MFEPVLQHVERFKEEDEPEWIRALWKSDDVAGRSLAYFDGLLYSIRKPSHNERED